MTEKLGIVYTPVEVVDFIIHSVNDVLKSEFGKTFADDNVHVLDPFTGTGTFINRLLQSGLIPADRLTYKYKNEIHANEIVLLAYYIASINIETVYHDQMKIINPEMEYTPFEGICLTDTFEMYEKEDLVSKVLADNSERRKRQKDLDIRVIIGNPPYSAGQSSQNENNQNVKYEYLDKRIYETYTLSSANLLGKRSSLDSYIRAIRWASDRIEDQGVVGFITNSGYLSSNAADGIRKCLIEEFSSLYIINLRGNSRTTGDIAKKEAGNIFDIRTPVAIAILVKNQKIESQGQLYYFDIGDYLSKKEKLEKLSDLYSISRVGSLGLWKNVKPDTHNDWLNQRDDSFQKFIKIHDKSNTSIFEKISLGVITNRDAWNYDFSLSKLKNRTKKALAFFNEEVIRYKKACTGLTPEKYPNMMEFVRKDLSITSWGGRSWKSPFKRFLEQSYDDSDFKINSYRPFMKQFHYASTVFNHSFYSIKEFFEGDNIVICISGNQGLFITNNIPDLHFIGDTQALPLYLYEKNSIDRNLFDHSIDPIKNDQAKTQTINGKYTRKDAISDEGLKHFQDAYPTETISKEDIFYYVYGLLHSEDYRIRYADNLSKELPRIPCVKKGEDFWTFSKAGRDLAHWHLNYETVEPYKAKLDLGGKSLKQLEDKDFYVTKMKFPKKDQKDTVIYNNAITIREIPLEAYDYVVNGKSALEWVMERQGVSTHKDSGIVNDANDWAIETMGDAKYPLELFLRVITVSLETMKIVKSLPKLDI